LGSYLSLLDMLNPMNRLWSDGRWNKLTVAHGCYWKKCSFCDVSLDYISRYESRHRRGPGRPHRSHRQRNRPDRLSLCRRSRAPQSPQGPGARADQAQAWPSAGGATCALKSPSRPSCASAGRQRLHRHLRWAGSGLRPPAGLMKKGVSVDQVARVTHAFTDAGILVHAYLMYGFPPRPCRTPWTRWNTCANSLRTAASSPASSTALPAPCTHPWGSTRRTTASRCSPCRP
jgi:hypothetical protein